MDTGMFNPRGFVTKVTYNTSNSSNQCSQRVSLGQSWMPTKIIFLGVPLRGGSRISRRGRQLQRRRQPIILAIFFKNCSPVQKVVHEQRSVQRSPNYTCYKDCWTDDYFRVPLDVTFILAAIKAFDDNFGNLVLSAENTIRSAQWTLMGDLQWNYGFCLDVNLLVRSCELGVNMNL